MSSGPVPRIYMLAGICSHSNWMVAAAEIVVPEGNAVGLTEPSAFQ